VNTGGYQTRSLDSRCSRDLGQKGLARCTTRTLDTPMALQNNLQVRRPSQLAHTRSTQLCASLAAAFWISLSPACMVCKVFQPRARYTKELRVAFNCPSWARTRTLLIQSQACCQLHQGADYQLLAKNRRHVNLKRLAHSINAERYDPNSVSRA
jgi:hypothetical protein